MGYAGGMMHKRADIDHEILDVLAERWSPRAFADRPVEVAKVRQLFEAARWSASSYNEQPWRFIVADRFEQPELFDRVLGCLVDANSAWAKAAPILALTITRTTFAKNGKPNRVHQHDLGLAMGNLSIQATALGLAVHQMAGVLPAKVAAEFRVPEGFKVQTGFAVGYEGDPASLPEELQKAERAERTRMKLSEFVFGERFGEPAAVVKGD